MKRKTRGGKPKEVVVKWGDNSGVDGEPEVRSNDKVITMPSSVEERRRLLEASRQRHLEAEQDREGPA
jgi:hypothetical protein